MVKERGSGLANNRITPLARWPYTMEQQQQRKTSKKKEESIQIGRFGTLSQYMLWYSSVGQTFLAQKKKEQHFLMAVWIALFGATCYICVLCTYTLQ